MMKKQRVCGIILLVACVGFLVLAWHGTTLEERDITPVVMLAPLGLYLIFTKQKVMYDLSAPEKKKASSDYRRAS